MDLVSEWGYGKIIPFWHFFKRPDVLLFKEQLVFCAMAVSKCWCY